MPPPPPQNAMPTTLYEFMAHQQHQQQPQNQYGGSAPQQGAQFQSPQMASAPSETTPQPGLETPPRQTSGSNGMRADAQPFAYTPTQDTAAGYTPAYNEYEQYNAGYNAYTP